MADFISNLKAGFRQGSVPIQLVYINIGIFLAATICHLVNWLFQLPAGWPDGWVDYLMLPSNLNLLWQRPWSIISYMFLHEAIWHLLFNMLCLYGFGQLFLMFFSARHLRGVYLLGGLAGGVLFLLAQFLPVFQKQADSMLLGASASVLALITAVAAREPNLSVRLFLFGNIRMKYIALALIVFSVISVSGENSGGEVAHLGGALAGWLFTFCLNKGYDLTKWINALLDGIQALFTWKPKPKRPKKAKMKVDYSKEPKDWQFNEKKKKEDENIDHILEKLKRSGYESLSAEEKKSLFDASKR